MSVLSKKEIETRLAKEIDDEESLVITPLLDREAAFDIDALDLRLGCYFLLPKLSSHPYYCPGERFAPPFHTRVYVPFGRFLVVPAHQTVLAATLEFIKLPHDVCGQILTKSSVARTFTVIETAPWIHPNYRGCLTLEVANASHAPILLYPGRSIGQLVLTHLEPKPLCGAPLSRKYFGPVLPESPTFDPPDVELSALGVKQVSQLASVEARAQLEQRIRELEKQLSETERKGIT